MGFFGGQIKQIPMALRSSLREISTRSTCPFLDTPSADPCLKMLQKWVAISRCYKHITMSLGQLAAFGLKFGRWRGDYPRHGSCWVLDHALKWFKHPSGEGMFTWPGEAVCFLASFFKNPVVTHQLFENYRLPNPENASRKLSPEVLKAPPISPIIPLPTCNWWSTPSIPS